MFRKLRGKMFEYDVTQAQIGKECGVCPSYLSKRFNGKLAFEIEMIYTICDMLEIPYEEIHIYFPRGGK